MSNCRNNRKNLHEYIPDFSRQACYDALNELSKDDASEVSSISSASTNSDTKEHETDNGGSSGHPAPPAQAVGVAVPPPLPVEVHTDRKPSFRKADSVNSAFGGVNPYMRVMLAVGSVLMDYDTDKVVPVMGFGGLLRGERRSNQCFPLADTFEVNEMTGVIDAYMSWLVGLIFDCLSQLKLESYCSFAKDGTGVPKVTFSGPTHFSPCLKKCLEYARERPCTQVGYCCSIILSLLIFWNCVSERAKVSHHADYHGWRLGQS
jgi:hypothetical protein